FGCVFFFQAEDGIRDYKVTGVQTCALPISGVPSKPYSFSDVLNSNMWGSIRSVGEFEQQNTMLQPIGGMERTPRAFVAHIGNMIDRKSTRLNSSHLVISYAVFCLKKKKLST